MDPLATLSPGTRAWFERAFSGPTPAQELAWPAIASGGHVLVQAPTGSGKTLAAFLLGIDRLNPSPGEGLRLLYVSPLKALNYDIERNLRGPLAGIGSALSVGVRTGDTPQRDRERMLRTPPDVLITTPESLYLLLTSRGRELLKTRRDGDPRRGARGRGDEARRHLSVSLERLERVVEQPFQRIGLSATQRPLAEIGRWVAGPAARSRSSTPARARSSTSRSSSPSRTSASSGRRGCRSRSPCAGRGRDGLGVRGDIALDLAVDLPGAPRAGARPPLDDRLRQQPPARRAARAAHQRARPGGRRRRRSP